MPISLTLSKRGGKEKLNNSVGSSAISTDNTQMDNSTVSSQEASKDWAQDSIDFPKIETSAEDSSNPDSSMKSIIGRSSAKQPLDPDSSSLGPIESAKEAKEKDKNKSWVKTIGMRTLRLRKNNAESSKSKAHSSSSHSIFSSAQSPSHSEGSSTSAGVKQTEQVGMGSETGTSNSSTAVPGSTQLSLADTGTGTGTSKLKFGKSKKSSNSTVNTSTSSNGIALREMLSSITHPSTSPSSPSSVTSSADHNATGKQAAATGAGAGTGAGQSGTNQETEGTNDKQDPARFAGDGMSFKAKLIGVLEVSGPRGDRICQEALSELKMAVKAAGEHKQKITVHIALDGLRIRDEKTGDCLYHHQVHKISFIAQDLTDARAFGYIFGSPDMGHRFFGIKTEKSASQVVIAMRDLFQVVFDLKKKEIERAKQQLEMQQKFLATRAAETSAPKTDHKSSIAETYIEGACALGSSSLSSPGISNVGGGGHTSASACASNTVPEVDLLNLEVELNSLQEGLDNIHNNLADSVPFRGSTASISSDPMNAMSSSTNNTNTPNATNAKFSILGHGGHGITGGNANSNFTTTSGDPFGDSFDPFDSGVSSMGFSSGATSSNHLLQQHRQNSSMTSPSPVAFGGSDPFAQIDPFPQPTFSNLESSDSFFNSDPFDTSGPGGSGPSSGTGGNLGSSNSNTNFSFNFGGDGIPSEPQQHHNTSVSSEREMRISQRNSSSSAIGNSHANVNSSSSMGVNSSGGANRSQNSNEFQLGWQASFDDNFVHDMNGTNANDSKGESLDVFTELDPLGTGRVRPFVDRKDFFQDLKNPPRRVLKDLYSTEGGSAVQFSSGEDYPQPQQPLQPSQQQPPPQQQQHPMKSLLTAPGSNNKVQANTTTSDTINSIPNSFSTHFNPPTSKPKTTGIHDSNATTGAATALPGFDSAFKTALHASSMSSVRNQTLANQSSQAVTRNTREFTASRSSRIKASHFRSDSPPNYSPPPPPPSAATDTNISFTNNEYFARPATNTITNMTASATPPPLLPPPSSSLSLSSKDSASGIATTRISPRTAKKSPHLLKQMTISNPTNMNTTTSNSSSPKTLPRSARLGKQFTVDVPSSDENSPIPNLTPPPRPPHGHGHGLGGTLGRNSHITLSTAVPRPYSGSAGTSASSGMTSVLSSNRGRYGPTTMTSNQGPEPPPRPLQTTMISSINVTPTATPSISSVTSQQQQQQQPLTTSQLQVNSQEKSGKLPQMSLVSPPPLPPKKTSIGPTLSNPIILSGSNKNLYTRESRDVSSKSSEINDLPLPLPSRKNPQQQYQQWNQPGNFNFNSINSFETGGGGNRYCVPPMQHHKNPDEDNNAMIIKSSPSAPSSTVIPRSRKSSNQSNHSNSNYGYTSDLDNPKPQLEIGTKLAKLTMEQALQQVASVSLGQLAVKLNLPVDKLSNFTIHQLAEKLTMMEMPSATASLGSSPNPNNQRLEIQTQNQMLSASTTSLRSQFTPSNNFAAAFESNFTAGEFEDDFSTMSAPGGFTSNANVKTNTNSRHKTGASDEDGSKNYDKYAAFRELTVEDASGFSLSSSGVKNQNKGIIGTARPRPRTSKSRSRSGSRSRSSDDDDDEDDPSQSTKTLNAPGADQHLIMIMDGVADIAGIDSRDSSSERTLQVEGVDSGGGMLSYHGSIGGNLDLDISQANNTNTMDDVTDANLSDDPDQDQFYNDMGAKCEFPDDEVASFASNLSGCGNGNSWATFESNFDDHFNVPSKPKVISTTMAPTKTSTVLPRPPIKLQSLKNKNRESPWDSDDDGGGSMMSDNTFKLEANNLTGAKGSAAPPPVLNSLIFDDKLLECVLPPDPEEFNFQPFEKPSPIITVSARRSSRDRERHSQNQPPQLEGSEPPFVDFDGRPTAQFKRQSSGSSKHSVGKNSDYSDSGRNRSRNNSRDFDTWDRKESSRDYNRSDSRNSYNSGSNRLPLDVHVTKPPTDRDRDRERKYRAGGGGGDSEEEFGVPFKYSAENSRDSSLRRSGGSGSGSCTRSRPGSGKTRGMSGKHSRGYPISNRTDDDNEEEDEEDDDQSYNSYYSQSHSRRHHRVRYPNKYTQHHRSQQSLHSMGGGTGPRTNRKQNPLSPDRCYSNSNHESDEFDDSYDEDEPKSTAGVGGGVPGTMPGTRVPSRKQREYSHEYDVDYEYGGKEYHMNRIKEQQQRRPGSGSSLASSGNKRYANISPLDDRDRERERDRDRHNYRPERGPRGEMDSPREYYRSASGQGQRYHHRGDYRGRKYREEDSSKVNEDEDVMDDGGPKDQYSDYSCEDNPNMNSGRPHRDQRDRRYGSKGGRRSVGPLTTGGHRDRDQYDRPYRNCHTNSPSWDSESQSQSPDRDGANSNSNSGCERRKIRWGSSEKSRDRRDPQFQQQQQQQQHKPKSRGSLSGSRNSSQIQNPMGPLKAPGRLPVNTVTGITATTTLVATVATTDFHFEDDFSFATGNKDKELTEIVPNSSTSVSLNEVLGSGTCHIPPQSPFEDNFVVPVTISEGQGHAVLTSDKLRQDSPDGFDSIEFKRGCEEDNFSLGLGLTLTNLISGDIFFPAKFDVDLEVEKESRRFNNAVATASIIDPTTASTSMTPTPTYTPSSADLTRSSPSMSAMLISNVSSTTKRLESIRSEEERQESSEDGGDNLSDKEIPNEIQNVNEKESVDLNLHSTEQDLEISVARPEPVPELESLSDTTTVTVSDAAATTTNDLKIDIKSELITNHDIISNTINENKNEEDDLSDDEPDMTAPTDARPPPPTTASPNNTVNNLNNLSNNNRNANRDEDNSVNNTTNMKKSESFNIFDRDKDPFADDDFFS